MSNEFLQTLWFILIAILWLGFFFLEGFDFGVGMLLPFLSKKDIERRAIINTIGPHWDGNEVWLLTAGGASFAAFPNWYATFFSGFYPALFLLLIGLILRGVAFEFRSKDPNKIWRAVWDWVIFSGSILPAFLFGVAFANLLKGVPVDASLTYTGNLLTLLNPYGLLGGLTAVVVFTLHGANFLSLKLSGDLQERAHSMASKFWPATLGVTSILLVATWFMTDLPERMGIGLGLIIILGSIAIICTGLFIRRKRDGWAFILTSTYILLTMAVYFLTMFPNLMLSSTDPNWSITISNASSSPYTLNVMTIVALIFIPLILVYQGWTYYIFRKRVIAKPENLTY